MSSVPRSRSTDKRFYGVVEGLVTDNADPDREGKVRVNYPWFDSQTISEWCRILQPYAGSGYGHFFVPEIGDEVVVGFAHGDMRLPIILGGVYNGKDKPPSHRDDATDEKMIRTKAGHQILLNDSKDNHQVKITTSGGHEVDLNDQKKSVTITTSGGQSITLDDQASSVTIKTSGGQSITLDPTGGVTISATTVTIDATSISLGQAAVAGLGSLIKGGAFVELFNTHVHPLDLETMSTLTPTPPIVPAKVLSLISKTA
ncbi:MAG TPA: phage baseplate assembly protein V [Isosphaeraceae bacterium]|nr:phage baseplate assembly protein V [Isosphaeraceae bacterium]